MLATETTREVAASRMPAASQLRRARPLVLAVLVLALALVVRVQYLMDVPSFTDETDEVLRGLAIARGQLLPLVNDNTYIGAFSNYLIAGLFLIGGPNPVSPRLLTLAAGMATVTLTLRLGREVGGAWTGLLAGALLATSGLHIVINSRIAWSHALTPFFTTAALLSLLLALRRASARLLLLTGLLAGLAIQTHPSAVALLPALAGTYLASARGRAWLRRPWPYLSGLAIVLGCANVLWYNVITEPGAALREAAGYEYAYQTNPSLATMIDLWPQFAVDVVRALGSVYGTRTTLSAYLTNPAFIVTAALLIVGLALAIARRQWLLPLTLLGAALVLPFFGRQFAFLPQDTGRYLSFLLPPGFVLLAGAVVDLGRGLRLAAARLPWSSARGLAPALAVGATFAFSLALVWFPLSGTLYFQATFRHREETPLITAVVDAAARARTGAIYVEEGFNRDLLFGGGHLQHAFIYLLELRGLDYRNLTLLPRQRGADLAALLTPGTVVILRDESYTRLADLGLEPLFVATPEMRGSRRGYGVYRVASAAPAARALPERHAAAPATEAAPPAPI